MSKKYFDETFWDFCKLSLREFADELLPYDHDHEDRTAIYKAVMELDAAYFDQEKCGGECIQNSHAMRMTHVVCSILGPLVFNPEYGTSDNAVVSYVNPVKIGMYDVHGVMQSIAIPTDQNLRDGSVRVSDLFNAIALLMCNDTIDDTNAVFVELEGEEGYWRMVTYVSYIENPNMKVGDYARIEIGTR